MVDIPSSLTTTVLMLALGASSALAQIGSSQHPGDSPRNITTHPSPYTTSLRGQQSDYAVLYVNPMTGDDLRSNGGRQQPFKTITHALQIAQPGTVIVLAPGRYTAETGETFPLQLKPGVTLQGSPNASQSVIILGGGRFQSGSLSQQNATILMSDRSGLGYVVVSNNQSQGHGVWVEAGRPVIRNNAFVANQHTGVYVADGTPLLEGNYFNQNQVAGLVLYGDSQAVVRSNHFESTGTAITVASTAVPEIVGNRIIRNDEGIVLLGNARPTLASNEISQNRRNGVVEVESSPQPPTQIVATASTNPTALIAAAEPVRSPSFLSPPSSPVSRLSTEASVVEPSVESSSDITASEIVQPVSIQPESLPTSSRAQRSASAVAVSTRSESVPVDLSTSSVSSPPVEADERIEPDEPAAPISISALRNRRLNQANREESPSHSDSGTPHSNGTEAVSNAPIIIFESGNTQPTQSISPPVVAESDATSSPAEADVDLASLPSLSTTSRLNAPNALPTTQPIDTDTNASSRAASTAENVEQPVSISALRNRLLTRETAEPAPLASASAIGSSQPSSIPIEVIPANPSTSPIHRSSPPTPAVTVPAGSGQRLPVPGSSIPVGRGGGHRISTTSPSTRYDGSPPPPPSRATALGLSYRVLVDAQDDATQRRVRGLVPDAFRTRFQGRTLMQAGAFPDEATARERLQLLLNNGLDARVEYLP